MQITKPVSKVEKELLTKQKTMKLNHRKESYSRLSPKYYTEWWKYRQHKKRMFLINMKLRNKNIATFIVAVKGKFFKYEGGAYFIDPDFGCRDLVSGYIILNYHQDCAMPFLIDYNIDELNKKLTTYDKTIVKTSNPYLLNQFIESEVIEKVMKGQELSDQLNKIYKIVIIGLIVNIIAVFMIAKASGWI